MILRKELFKLWGAREIDKEFGISIIRKGNLPRQ